MEALAILVMVAAFAFLVFCIGGFNDLIERRHVAKNQAWRKMKGGDDSER